MWQWAFRSSRRATGDPPRDLALALDWLAKNTRPLRDIGDAAVARGVLQALATRKDGTPAAATTIARKRAVLYNVLELAVEHDHFPANPLDRIKWRPPRSTPASTPGPSSPPPRPAPS